ncbi:MAG: hypothetical protein KC416_15080, partial [Myxococcales bacterium]|nr:hypothetical protein [Myxococcales bacterium]
MPAEDLKRRLAARLLPLSCLAAAIVATSAPTAFYLMRTTELRVSASQVARDLAVHLAHEAERRPVLWKYDSIKVLDHLRSTPKDPALGHLEVRLPRGES